MSETLTAVLFALVFIGGPFFLIWLLDRRAKKEGVPGFLKRLAVVLAVSAIALYGALWAATHPDEPISMAFAVAVIALFVLAFVASQSRLFKSLIELLRSFSR